MRSLLFLAVSASAALAPVEAQVRSPQPPATTAPARITEHGRRDDWQRVPDIFTALGAKPGARIADLGAGEGWLTTRLARQVGGTGRVFAADISERALTSLSETLASAGITNVELVLSEDDDPRLPFGTLDGVVILNAYHEMVQRVAVLDGIKRALKSGGVLVIVDNAPIDSTLRTRKDQTARHQLAIEFARDELESHGFELVSDDPDFITRPMDSGNVAHREWILVARKRAR